VREILLQAKKCGVKDYAIAYLLFGAGLTASDITRLRVNDYQIQANHGILRIKDTADQVRSVPVNQKILGHRYGSATNNPLSAYLKSRKQEIKERAKGVQGKDEPTLERLDHQETMFLSGDLQPLSLTEIEQMWTGWTETSSNPDGTPLTLMQARHTWCIEMLARGMDADSFCIISGIKPKELKAYQTRLNEKLAIDKAIALDS